MLVRLRLFFVVLLISVLFSSFVVADGVDDFLAGVLEDPGSYTILIDPTLDEGTQKFAMDLQKRLGTQVIVMDPSGLPDFTRTIVVSRPDSPFLAGWNFSRPSFIRIDMFRGLKLFVVSDRAPIHRGMIAGLQRRGEIMQRPVEEELVVEQAAPRSITSFIVMVFVGVAAFGVVIMGIAEVSRKKRLHDPQLRLRQYFSMLLKSGYTQEQLMQSAVPALVQEGWKEHIVMSALHSASHERIHEVHA